MATFRQILGHRSRQQQILKFLTISGLSATGDSVFACMCVCVCVCVCACVHACACVCACMRACVCECHDSCQCAPFNAFWVSNGPAGACPPMALANGPTHWHHKMQ